MVVNAETQSAETMTLECPVTNGTSVSNPTTQSSGTVLGDRAENYRSQRSAKTIVKVSYVYDRITALMRSQQLWLKS